MTHKSPLQSKIPVSILAGLGASLLVVGISDSCVTSTRVPAVSDRAMVVPLVAPTIVSSESTADRADLSTGAGTDGEDKQPIRLNPAQIAFKEAKLAVSLSKAQLVQARINLIEFQAKHNNAKILSEQGKLSRKHADTAKTAYELAQLQHSSASIGLQKSTTQLIAAKAEIFKLGRKANNATEM
jgi:hypothetical protein